MENEDFHTEKYLKEDASYKFTLKDNAKILLLDGSKVSIDTKIVGFSIMGFGTPEQLMEVRKQLTDDQKIFCGMKNDIAKHFALDWDYIFSKYDGIELIHGNVYNILHYDGFYSWDVDSICIWDNVIQII